MPFRPAPRLRVAAAAFASTLAAAIVALSVQGVQARPARAGVAANPNGPATGKFTAPEYVMGSARARVSVVEYLSDTCVHCARFDIEVFPKIKANYIDTGKVKWTVREMLTDPQAVSAAGFVLARCAGRDKYWPMIEAIFRGQDAMYKSGDVHGTFLSIARSMGMTEPQFDACVQDDEAFAALNARSEKAVNVDKVEGTPTFLVNGKRYISEMNLAEMEKAIAEAGAARAQP